MFLDIEKRMKNLKSYNYKSTDKSILANYVLKYYWDWALQFVPIWMAPNLLTLIGLIIMLASIIINLYFSIRLDGTVPQCVYLINGLSLFLYSTLDCVDGKQARRTNSSSPLGQLFDHGVDSIVASLIPIQIAQSLALGISYNNLCILFSLLIGFYVVTIDEYFTHSFYLGYINGPTEGIILGVVLQILIYLTSPKLFNSLKGYHIYTMISFIPYKFTNIEFTGIIFVFFTYFFSTISTLFHRKKGTVFEVIVHSFTPLILFFSTLLYYIRFSKFESFHYFYILILTNLMLNFSLVVILVIFSHLTATKLIYYTPMFYFFIVSSGLIYFLTDFTSIFILFISTMLSIYIYFLSISQIIFYACEHLEIYCFVLGKKEKSKDIKNKKLV